MQALRALMKRYAATALCIALLAVAARIAIPAGLMPVASPGGVTFVLCSGTADASGQPVPVYGSHHGSDSHDRGGPHDGGGPCAFAALGAAGNAPDLAGMVALPAPAAAALANPLATPGFALGAGLGRPPLPARAPPMDA